MDRSRVPRTDLATWYFNNRCQMLYTLVNQTWTNWFYWALCLKLFLLKISTFPLAHTYILTLSLSNTHLLLHTLFHFFALRFWQDKFCTPPKAKTRVWLILWISLLLQNSFEHMLYVVYFDQRLRCYTQKTKVLHPIAQNDL